MNLSLLLLRLRAMLLLVLAACALPVAAQQTTRQVSLPNQDYTESTVDLAVKVLGGVVEIRRTWTWGRWYLNDKWADLQLQPDALGGIKSISRAGRVYSRQGAHGGAYSFDERNHIRATESGWQWYDPFGNSIDYDKEGRALGWSNPAGVRVSLMRDDEGRILGVKDHHGRQRISIEYEGLLPVRVHDTAGRSVSYRWRGQGSAAPGSNGSIGLAQLEQVTDVRGGSWHYSYTRAGYIEQRTDPAGGQITISYLTQPERKLWAPGSTTHTTKVQLPAAIRVASLTDESGAVTRWRVDYERVKRRYHVSIEHPGGSQQTMSYDQRGRLIRNELQGQTLHSIERLSDSQDRSTDARGLVTITHYNSARQATRIIHPDGSTEDSQYNHAGRKTAHRSASGTLSAWRYDAQGNELEHIEAVDTPAQRTTLGTWDEWGQKTGSTTGAGDGKGADAATERFAYDSHGNLSAHTDALGNTTRYTHDSQGNVLTETDPLGNITSYQYDAAGHLLKVTNPLGHSTSTQYDALGQKLSATTAEGRTQRWRYDAGGRLVETLAPGQSEGQGTRIQYDEAGRPTTHTSAGGLATTTAYDKMGRIASLTDPAGNTIRYEYGEADSPLAGLLTKTIYPTYTETYQYDQRSRQSAVTQLLGEQGKEGEERTQRQRRVYAPDGNLLATFDAEENATLHTYDALGRLTKTTDPLGGETSQTWDARDNLTSLTDAEGNTHRFEYDAGGNLTKETRPLGGSTSYEWDAAGRLTKRTDAEGNTRHYTWDAAGRLTREEHKAAGQAGQTLEQTISYQYDKDGLLTGCEQTDGQGQLISAASYQRDAQGRITSTDTSYGKAGSTPLTFHTEQGHNADGQPASLTYPDGSQQSYAYTNGQLNTITTPADEAITYSAYNWLAPRIITMPGASTATVWDALLRPRHQTSNAGGNVIASRSHEYNQLGRVTAIATDAGRSTYAYDRLGRLTDAEPNDKHRQLGLPEEHYLYDKVGNRTASAHQSGIWRHNQDNQLTSYPRYFTTLADGSVMNEDIAVSYTQTGHTKEEKGLNWQRQYSYNAAERLSKVEDKRNDRTASYTYDPFGRRISKTIRTHSVTPQTTTTYYIYGEHGLMAEADEQGTLTKAYGFHPDAQANGLWSTNPVWQADISNGKLKDEQTAWHYLHTDNLGTPYMATNKQGQRTWRAYQQAFGEAIIDKNSTTTVNLRFPGQYFDEETGTHYNFQRDYNPYTGRYLQADPIGLDGGLNLYRYAYDSPLVYMDPEGEVPWPLIWGAINGAMSAFDAYLNPCSSPKDVAKQFAAGFITGALGAWMPLSRIKLLTAAARNFSVSVVNWHISKAIERESLNPFDWYENGRQELFAYAVRDFGIGAVANHVGLRVSLWQVGKWKIGGPPLKGRIKMALALGNKKGYKKYARYLNLALKGGDEVATGVGIYTNAYDTGKEFWDNHVSANAPLHDCGCR